jgi:hypothetical protein
MPFDVVGQHAEEQVSGYPVDQPVMNGANLEIHGLEAPEGALDLAQELVGPDRLWGGEPIAREAGADDVEAVKSGFFPDAVLVDPILEGPGRDGEAEMLRHLLPIQMGV